MATTIEQESREPSGEVTTDEDTEDASEPEKGNAEADESGAGGSWEERLSALRLHLKQLEDGSDMEYVRIIKELEEIREERLFVAEVFRDFELQNAIEEHEREKAMTLDELEAKKLELKECLINDMQEKKKAYETFRLTGDLASGVVENLEPKMMVTRKLRRRHYDPLPIPAAEKRRKSAPLSTLVYVLDESEVEEDLKVIFKGKISSNPVLSSPVPVANGDGSPIYETRIEDGKLLYENRWFHKGQHIFIESKEHGQESGIITSISQNEIWVKRLPDNSKLRIYMSQLAKGKYVLRRRSA
ncbi:hypothetical protein EMCRGX_G023924 [Ephydatia muelleri]